MKKALPFIIAGVIVLIIIILWIRSRQNQLNRLAAEQSIPSPESSSHTFSENQFPTENQIPDVVTTIAPTNTSVTPPVVQGNPPVGLGCLNHAVVVALIAEWKDLKIAGKKMIRRLGIKSQLKEMCPEALIYLVV